MSYNKYKVHWMSDWKTEIDMKHVKFAHKLLEHPLFHKPELDYIAKTDGCYIIKKVYVSGYTVNDVFDEKTRTSIDKGAVFFKKDGLIRLGESYYPPLRFSVPKSQLVKYETVEEFEEQNIMITEWAYNNSFMSPLNKIYEDWGRHIYSFIDHYGSEAWNTPMFTSSLYHSIIEEMKKMQIREDLKKLKRRDNVFKEDKKEDRKPDNKGNDEKLFRKEALYTFFTDGSGNWYSDGKRQSKGHFSVFLKNTKQRWKHSEDKLTSNQAELLGVMSAIQIAKDKGFNNVLIYTDSKNVIEWITKNASKECGYNWEANNINVKHLVERLREMLAFIPKLEIKHIKRGDNYAHDI